MCVSHGLDPRHFSREQILERELEAFVEWAELAPAHAGNMWPSRPTTRRTYPIITANGVLEAWWGQLLDGKPAPWPLGGANARSERFRKDAPTRALVPVSYFYERQDSDRAQWWRYEHGNDPLLLAATIQPGVLADGTHYTCYSVLTQDPPQHLAQIHSRTVMVVPPGQAQEWLYSTSKSIVADTLHASTELQTEIQPVHLEEKPA
jgi:hypothetical protein